MADGDLLLIYRSFSTKDLLTKKKKLIDQMTSITSMSVGSKSFTRDIRYLQDQLAAIVFVLNERSNGVCGYEGTIVTDFSGGDTIGQPSGVEENLNY